MINLSSGQFADLRSLQQTCVSHGAELVIIGAVAYQAFIDDTYRHTQDIDVAIALDLENFANFRQDLLAAGWQAAPRQEQRWRGPASSWVDIVPAGSSLRAARTITWPESDMTMSLVGFDHVFQDSVTAEIGEGLSVKVIPPTVLGLLKIVAYMEDPHRRFKDLIDLRSLLTNYEQRNGRLFSEEVFAANLPDIEFASAFLLGLDLANLCTSEELSLVREFIGAVSELDSPRYSDYRRAAGDSTKQELQFIHQEVEAFKKGLQGGSHQQSGKPT